jgi:hypothetical protein
MPGVVRRINGDDVVIEFMGWGDALKRNKRLPSVDITYIKSDQLPKFYKVLHKYGDEKK